jgi:hypothetical protein
MSIRMARNDKWYQLDNVAKIIPSTARGGDTRVFRITCELTEKVDPDILQEALDSVIQDFPHFNCILRRGFFWYYLDARNFHPTVLPDHLPACSPIYFPGRKNMLYRINYFDDRINLEMFHVLADGTGAFVFFRALISCYLSLKYKLDISCESDETSSKVEKGSDAYRQFYQKQRGLRQLREMSALNAYQIKGEPDENLLPHLIEGTVSARLFLDTAHRFSTSVGILATSVYIAAVIDEMSVKDKKKPVVVSVPVNLRKYFPSDTTRNFFGVINISYQPDHFNGDISTIINEVRESFTKQLSKEKILQTMNSYAALEHNIAIQMAPLFIKDFAIGKLSSLAKHGVTSTMSNLGNISMPPETVPYIRKFCGFMPAPSEQICVMTFQDNMVFGEVTAHTTHEVMLHFFRRLTAMGIPVELASNDYDVPFT